MVAHSSEVAVMFHPFALTPTVRNQSLQTVDRLVGIAQQGVDTSHVVEDLSSSPSSIKARSRRG